MRQSITRVRSQDLGPLILALAFVVGFSVAAGAQVRSIDGSGNNIADPDLGAADTPLLRVTTVAYGDGLSTPAGASRPSARAVSNAVSDQSGPVPNSPFQASDFIWQWGQLLDHDIDLTENVSPAEPFDIPVPTGDPNFDPFSTGTEVIPLNRSVFDVDGAGVCGAVLGRACRRPLPMRLLRRAPVPIRDQV